MTVYLFAFGLKPEHVQSTDDKFAQWIFGLEEYLQSVAGDAVVVRYSARPAAAPWIGSPFLLIGHHAAVASYFDGLSDQARRLLADCAYFWVLSDSEQAGMQCADLPKDRIVTLITNSSDYAVIWAQLQELVSYPYIVGLSRELHVIRSEISRIGNGKSGAGTPVLVLGETGSGKSLIAKGLHTAERRSREYAWDRKDNSTQSEASGSNEEEAKLNEIACGYFTEHTLQDQLFGHYEGAFTGADKDKLGLLVTNGNGTLVLNDFDVAPVIQAALLSVLDTRKGESAKITRLGGEGKKPDDSWVWLIFTTNADIGSLVDQKVLREDFLFRFEERVIYIPPLRERPADIPAIAIHIWERSWDEGSTRQRALAPPVMEWLMRQKTEWRGNIRALRALLSLAASMAKLPAHYHRTAQSLLSEIMSRGEEYPQWIRILATKNFSGSVFQRDSAIGTPLQETEKNVQGQISIVQDAPEVSAPRKPFIIDQNFLVLKELRNALSPKWSWLKERGDEDQILAVLQSHVSNQGLDLLKKMVLWLNDRTSRNEPDNPRGIHLYKLLLYLALRGYDGGHRAEFRKVLGLEWAQTEKVVKQLVALGLIVEMGKDRSAVRFTLAQGLLEGVDRIEVTLNGAAALGSGET